MTGIFKLGGRHNTDKKLKLLVTGASGFIGHEVARQLSFGGYRPRLMIRYPGDDCEICHFDAEFVLADLRIPESLDQAVKGVDGIIHLAARATFESYDTLKPSILDGSLALMKAGIAAGVRRFVYGSSLLVYNDCTSRVDADTPVNPALDYGRVKVETEKRLSEMAASAGVSFAALRLPHVYGARDLYFRQLQAGRLILPDLETPSAVRNYNFNLAVDPDLLWKDLGMEPGYPTIHEGIPAVAAEGQVAGVMIT